MEVLILEDLTRDFITTKNLRESVYVGNVLDPQLATTSISPSESFRKEGHAITVV